MNYRPELIVRFYLFLWKELDSLLSDRRWAEVLPESPEDLKSEMDRYQKDDFSWAGHHSEALQQDLEVVEGLLRTYAKEGSDSAGTGTWRVTASSYRDTFQSKAIEFADEIILSASSWA